MRSTENKLLHIPLNTGMNQSVSPRLAPTGTLDLVQNCRISGNGILEKRPGTLGLTGVTSTDLNSVVGQATGRFRMIQGDAVTSQVYLPSFACTVQDALTVGNSYGDAFSFSTVWQFQGRFSTALPKRKRYGLAVDGLQTTTGFGASPPDIAINSLGYIGVAALTATGDVHFYIEDPNGVRVYYYQNSVGPAYSRVRVVAQTTAFMLVLQTGTAIKAFSFTLTSGAWGMNSSATVGTLSASSTFWDAYATSTSSWFLAYQGGATSISLVRYNFFSQLATATQTIGSSAATYVSLFFDAARNFLWLGLYDASNNVSYSVFDVHVVGSITNAVALQTLATGANLGPPLFGSSDSNLIDLSGSAFYVYRQTHNSGDKLAAIWFGFAQANATTHSVPVAAWHYVPVSKPDANNRVWCQHIADSGSQTTTRLVLLRFSDLNAPPTIELSSPNQLFLSSAPNPNYFSSYPQGSSSAFFAFAEILQEFSGGLASKRISVYEHTISAQEPHRASKLSGITTTIAGQPVEFYGQSVPIVNNTLETSATDSTAFGAGASEIGFPNSPIIFTATPSISGGSIELGGRSYRAVFEWIDMYGRRHQSAPSPPVSVSTVGAGNANSVAFAVSTLNVSQRQAPNTFTVCYVRMYSTVNGGTEYNELSGAVQAVDLVGGTGLVTFTATEADATIDSNGVIYTDGNVLQNDLAPSCRFLASSEQRVWFGGLWDATIIQASMIIVPGEPIQCTDDPSHQVVLPVPCTGLAYMDGNVIAFGLSSIYLISSGGGPNDQGAGAFSPPQQLTRSVGCVDYRSIVETNVGVFFQSELGLYLLPRGFGPAQYVGVGVQDVMSQANDARPTVLGAISQISEGNHLAQFLVATAGQSESQAQTVLSYDLDDAEWFSDTLPWAAREMASAGIGQPFRGSVFMLADLNSGHFTTPVLYETSSTFDDATGNGTAVEVSQVAQTAWVHPFGLGGWGKVKAVMVCAESLGATQTLTLTVQLDQGTPQVSVWTITGAQLNYRAMFLASDRACTAVQVTVQGDSTAGTLGGFKFVSCTIEMEPTDGIRLLADSEKN